LKLDVANLREKRNLVGTGLDPGKLDAILRDIETFQMLERHILSMSKVGTPAARAQSREVLGHDLLPLMNALYTGTADLIRTQEKLESDEFVDLQRANESVLWTLWTVTILGAVLR
jgi:hypothetical protein